MIRKGQQQHDPRLSGQSSQKKKQRPKFLPQKNTLLNYFGSTPPKGNKEQCVSSSSSSPENIRPNSPTSLSHPLDNIKKDDDGHSYHDYEAREHFDRHRNHNFSSSKVPRSPDSWMTSGSPPAQRYPAGQAGSFSSGWERHDGVRPGKTSSMRRHHSFGDEHSTSSRLHVRPLSPSDQPSSSTSQPLPDRTNKNDPRFRHVSEGSSPGSGNDNNKAFPIIRPLAKHQGLSYDQILQLAKGNQDKKNEKSNRSGLSSPGKHPHSNDVESDSSEDYSRILKYGARHRHSSGETHGGRPRHSSGDIHRGRQRHSSGEYHAFSFERSLMKIKSRHSSGYDKDLYSSDRHKYLHVDKKIYRDMMKMSPVVRIIKISTPSPVKITEELLKRCGSPGVLSDGAIPKDDDDRKGGLKRHHSADDADGSGSENATFFKSCRKRHNVPSESEHVPSSSTELDQTSKMSASDVPREADVTPSVPCEDNIPCDDKVNEHVLSASGNVDDITHRNEDSSSRNSLSAGTEKPATITGVRHLFRELGTPSGSDVGESGGEDNKNNNAPKPKFKLDINKLKSKLQISPSRKRQLSDADMTEPEPMDIGTESDASPVRSPTSPDKQNMLTTNVPLVSISESEDSSENITSNCLETECETSDMDNHILNDDDSKPQGSNIADGEADKKNDAEEQPGEDNNLATSPMDDKPSPEDCNNDKPTCENTLKPRSLEEMLAGHSDEEDLFASSDDSDDDFLMEKPSALQEIATLNALPIPDTPDKNNLSQISNDSLQSPCKAVSLSSWNDKGKKLKFTLDSMVDIRAQDGEVTDLKSYIAKNRDEKTKLSKELQLERENIADLQEELQSRAKEYKMDNEQIPTLHPGDDVFDCKKMGELFSFPDKLSLIDCGFNPLKANAMEKLLLNATPEDTIELINAQCLKEVYCAKPCPDSVMLWLFQLMSIHPSVYVTQNCFQTLWYLLTSCLSIHPMADPWVPTLREVTRVFLNYGSSFETLLPASLVQPGFRVDDIRPLIDNENQRERRHPPNGQHCNNRSLPMVNVLEIVKIFTQVLITHGLKGRGTCYAPEELQCLLFLICKTALDKKLIGCACQVDFQLCISALLEGFDDNIWEEQITEVCKTLSEVSSHHHNMVFVVQLMPTNSQRGRLMRRRLSYSMLKKILSTLPLHSTNMIQCGQNGTEIKVSDLLPILHACKPDAETDYYKLNSVITLIDLGVGNEPLKSLEKEDLERLILKLRELTGDIKDGFKFMNRTQVKDLMLRTVNKMTVLSQSMQSRQARLERYARKIREKSGRYSRKSPSNEDGGATERSSMTERFRRLAGKIRDTESADKENHGGWLVKEEEVYSRKKRIKMHDEKLYLQDSPVKRKPRGATSNLMKGLRASDMEEQQRSRLQNRHSPESPRKHLSLLFAGNNRKADTDYFQNSGSTNGSTQLSCSQDTDNIDGDSYSQDSWCMTPFSDSEELKCSLDNHIRDLSTPVTDEEEEGMEYYDNVKASLQKCKEEEAIDLNDADKLEQKEDMVVDDQKHKSCDFMQSEIILPENNVISYDHNYCLRPDSDSEKVMSFGGCFTVEECEADSLEHCSDFSEFDSDWDPYADEASGLSDDELFFFDEDEFDVLDDLLEDDDGESMLAPWNHPNSLFETRQRRYSELAEEISDSGSCCTVLSYSPHRDDSDHDTAMPDSQENFETDHPRSVGASTTPSKSSDIHNLYYTSDEDHENDFNRYFNIELDYHADVSDFSDGEGSERDDTVSDHEHSEIYMNYFEWGTVKSFDTSHEGKSDDGGPECELTEDEICEYQGDEEETEICKPASSVEMKKDRHTTSPWNHPGLLFAPGMERDDTDSGDSYRTCLSYAYHSDESDIDSPFYTPIKLVDFPRKNIPPVQKRAVDDVDKIKCMLDENKESDSTKDSEQNKPSKIKDIAKIPDDIPSGIVTDQSQSKAEIVHDDAHLEKQTPNPSSHYFDAVQSCFVDADGNPIIHSPLVRDLIPSAPAQIGSPDSHSNFVLGTDSPQFSPLVYTDEDVSDDERVVTEEHSRSPFMLPSRHNHTFSYDIEGHRCVHNLIEDFEMNLVDEDAVEVKRSIVEIQKEHPVRRWIFSPITDRSLRLLGIVRPSMLGESISCRDEAAKRNYPQDNEVQEKVPQDNEDEGRSPKKLHPPTSRNLFQKQQDHSSYINTEEVVEIQEDHPDTPSATDHITQKLSKSGSPKLSHSKDKTRNQREYSRRKGSSLNDAVGFRNTGIEVIVISDDEDENISYADEASQKKASLNSVNKGRTPKKLTLRKIRNQPQKQQEQISSVTINKTFQTQKDRLPLGADYIIEMPSQPGRRPKFSLFSKKRFQLKRRKSRKQKNVSKKRRYSSSRAMFRKRRTDIIVISDDDDDASQNDKGTVNLSFHDIGIICRKVLKRKPKSKGTRRKQDHSVERNDSNRNLLLPVSMERKSSDTHPNCTQSLIHGTKLKTNQVYGHGKRVRAKQNIGHQKKRQEVKTTCGANNTRSTRNLKRKSSRRKLHSDHRRKKSKHESLSTTRLGRLNRCFTIESDSSDSGAYHIHEEDSFIQSGNCRSSTKQAKQDDTNRGSGKKHKMRQQISGQKNNRSGKITIHERHGKHVTHDRSQPRMQIDRPQNRCDQDGFLTCTCNSQITAGQSQKRKTVCERRDFRAKKQGECSKVSGTVNRTNQDGSGAESRLDSIAESLRKMPPRQCITSRKKKSEKMAVAKSRRSKFHSKQTNVCRKLAATFASDGDESFIDDDNDRDTNLLDSSEFDPGEVSDDDSQVEGHVLRSHVLTSDIRSSDRRSCKDDEFIAIIRCFPDVFTDEGGSDVGFNGNSDLDIQSFSDVFTHDGESDVQSIGDVNTDPLSTNNVDHLSGNDSDIMVEEEKGETTATCSIDRKGVANNFDFDNEEGLSLRGQANTSEETLLPTSDNLSGNLSEDDRLSDSEYVCQLVCDASSNGSCEDGFSDFVDVSMGNAADTENKGTFENEDDEDDLLAPDHRNTADANSNNDLDDCDLNSDDWYAGDIIREDTIIEDAPVEKEDICKNVCKQDALGMTEDRDFVSELDDVEEESVIFLDENDNTNFTKCQIQLEMIDPSSPGRHVKDEPDFGIGNAIDRVSVSSDMSLNSVEIIEQQRDVVSGESDIEEGIADKGIASNTYEVKGVEEDNRSNVMETLIDDCSVDSKKETREIVGKKDGVTRDECDMNARQLGLPARNCLDIKKEHVNGVKMELSTASDGNLENISNSQQGELTLKNEHIEGKFGNPNEAEIPKGGLNEENLSYVEEQLSNDKQEMVHIEDRSTSQNQVSKHDKQKSMESVDRKFSAMDSFKNMTSAVIKYFSSLSSVSQGSGTENEDAGESSDQDICKDLSQESGNDIGDKPLDISQGSSDQAMCVEPNSEDVSQESEMKICDELASKFKSIDGNKTNTNGLSTTRQPASSSDSEKTVCARKVEYCSLYSKTSTEKGTSISRSEFGSSILRLESESASSRSGNVKRDTFNLKRECRSSPKESKKQKIRINRIPVFMGTRNNPGMNAGGDSSSNSNATPLWDRGSSNFQSHDRPGYNHEKDFKFHDGHNFRASNGYNRGRNDQQQRCQFGNRGRSRSPIRWHSSPVRYPTRSHHWKRGQSHNNHNNYRQRKQQFQGHRIGNQEDKQRRDAQSRSLMVNQQSAGGSRHHQPPGQVISGYNTNQQLTCNDRNQSYSIEQRRQGVSRNYAMNQQIAPPRNRRWTRHQGNDYSHHCPKETISGHQIVGQPNGERFKDNYHQYPSRRGRRVVNQETPTVRFNQQAPHSEVADKPRHDLSVRMRSPGDRIVFGMDQSHNEIHGHGGRNHTDGSRSQQHRRQVDIPSLASRHVNTWNPNDTDSGNDARMPEI